MKINIHQLRTEVENCQFALNKATAKLNDVIESCTHNWSDPVSAHEYIPGYTILGDPPGTCGVDWRGPCYVDARIIKKWKRQCEICGEVQLTENITQEVIEHPKFK